jgi:Cof subfamily protein (haloacid dehalogenase superfamily)
VDGTLALPDHRVNERTLAVLGELQRAGVRPVIVTGRSEGEAIRICREAGLTAPTVSCNGALVTDPVSGERLRQVSVEPGMLRATKAFAAAHGVQLLLWTADGVYAEQPSERTRVLEAINREPVLRAPLDQIDPSLVVKVMLMSDPARMDVVEPDARREVPFLERSMGYFLEATNPKATKWQSLRWVLRGLGLEPGECAGIADGDNDLEWLSRMGVPIAVANARPAVVEVADVVIGANSEESVAELLEQWVEMLAELDQA